jgi:Surface antigen variable number repeat
MRAGRRMVLGLAAILVAAGLAAGEPLRIGTITIRSLDVFSPAEASRGWFYRAANSLHIETRPSVIRKFLLFREGDPYDPAKLAESERNLRQLGFIKLASVVPRPPHDGLVDVDVVTQDAWTTEPGVSFGSKGGTTTYGFDLKEKDLLGTGRELSLNYDKGTERTTRSIQYKDPYIFGPYWFGQLVYAINSDGREEKAQVERPFFSFTSPWSLNALFDNLRQNERIYQSGETFSKFQQDHRQILAQYGLALRSSDERAQRLTGGFELLEDRFEHLTTRPNDLIPDDRVFRYAFIEYQDTRNDFMTLNYVNRDLRYEDFNLGRSIDLRLGVSPALFGAPRNTGLAELSASQGWRLGPASFLLAQAGFSTRFGGGLANEIVSANAFFVRKFDTKLLQTFVARLQYSQGRHLDRDVQFFADGLTGLRAYRIHAFEGNKSLILNVEHRVFSGKEILQIVAPGLAVFFDTGTAAPAGVPLRVKDFKSDAGVGLRFGIARAPSNNILRIDFAYAFNSDPRGRRGFLISFSSAQAF